MEEDSAGHHSQHSAAGGGTHPSDSSSSSSGSNVPYVLDVHQQHHADQDDDELRSLQLEAEEIRGDLEEKARTIRELYAAIQRKDLAMRKKDTGDVNPKTAVRLPCKIRP